MAEEPSAGRVARAFGWSFANAVLGRLGTVVIGIVLARLLGPAEFGIFGIAMVTLLATLAFNELGVSLAIVRWPDPPEKLAPTVNTISAAMSALLAGVLVAAAPAVSTLLGDVRATPVVQVLAAAVLINGLVATPAAALQREFKQGRRMVADQVNSWLGALVALGCALAGLGAMSLAIGRVVGSVVAAVLLVVWSPVPYRFGWDATLVRPLLRFGLPLAGASILVFAAGYADQVITGAALGATALGVYVLAFNLAGWPLSFLSQPLRAVAPAAFARLQHDPDALHAAFVRWLGLVSSAALPACLAIAGAAEPVVRFVYGPAWVAAGAVLAWLALGAALRIWFELGYDYLVVLGRSNTVLAIQVAWVAVGVPALIAGALLGGVVGLAAAQFAVTLVVVLPLYAGRVARAGISLAACARAVGPSVAVGAATWGVCRVIALAVPGPFAAAALSGLVGVAAVAALLWPHRRALATLRRPSDAGE